MNARLRLRVVPGARTSRLAGRHGDAWKLHVAAAPERGAANDAVVRLLADLLGVRRRDVNLVSGRGSRDKIVELSGIDADEAARRLANAEEATR
jgi:uncharacterized protein YggU (UPF0235/DUF167 family)